MAAKDYPEVGSFPSTHWSLIFSAHDQDPVRRREALGELLRLYLPALRAHLLYRRNIERHRAEDLLQGFVADQIFERDLLAKADAARGRFRSFLLRSLENYVINERQREARRREVALELDTAEGAASDVFEVQWARQLLQETLRRMREECENKGQPALWGIFECRVVGPTLTGSPPPAYSSLVERFGFRSAEQASNALVTAKRQFERTLGAVIAETECITSDKDIEAAIADLCRILNERRAARRGVRPRTDRRSAAIRAREHSRRRRKQSEGTGLPAECPRDAGGKLAAHGAGRHVATLPDSACERVSKGSRPVGGVRGRFALGMRCRGHDAGRIVPVCPPAVGTPDRCEADGSTPDETGGERHAGRGPPPDLLRQHRRCHGTPR